MQTTRETVHSADQHHEVVDVGGAGHAIRSARRIEVVSRRPDLDGLGQRVMPFRIEDELRKRGANYVQGGLFKAFVVRDGRLITGQQQYSGAKVGEAVIAALGV